MTRALTATRGWPAGTDPHRGATNSLELHALHRDVECVPCETCHAGLAVRCTHPDTGVATKIPHVARIAAARRAGVDLGCGVCDAGPEQRCGHHDRHGKPVDHPPGHRRVRPELESR